MIRLQLAPEAASCRLRVDYDFHGGNFVHTYVRTYVHKQRDATSRDAAYYFLGRTIFWEITLSYQTLPLEVLRKRRWYLPESLNEGRFQGLHIQECHDFAEPFILTAFRIQ